MQLDLSLLVDDPADEDQDDTTGLTNDAYSRLVDALADAGFSIDDGPTPVFEEPRTAAEIQRVKKPRRGDGQD